MAKSFHSASTPSSNPIGWGSISQLAEYSPPDVWNLHWVSWWLDWESLLPWMAEKAPIVWTLHDLNPLRGVWHYEPSPEERNERRVKLNGAAMRIKQSVLKRIPRERLVFVGPSVWMADSCRLSELAGGYIIEHIPYGLDVEVFTPRDRLKLRAMLGVPEGNIVLGFAAADLSDPRKGMASLESALKKLGKMSKNITLLTAGGNRIDAGRLHQCDLGIIKNERLLSYFYSACDLFVCPSLQDNLPNTVLESLSCGTPVIAYKTGGLPDMVKDGESGWLVSKVGDGQELSEVICELIRTRGFIKMRQSARSLAVREFNLETQALRYRMLWRQHFGL